ncbi:MAG: hypothetical protein KC609_05470 [Myxococcales bacterium]|nr:hypothetical protein [Myxococcales bacterium]
MKLHLRSIVVGSLLLLLWGCGGGKSTTSADATADATADSGDGVVSSVDASDQTTPDDTSNDTTDGSDTTPPGDAQADATGQEDGGDTAPPNDASIDPDQLGEDQIGDLAAADDSQTADLEADLGPSDDGQSADVSSVTKIYVFPFVFQAGGALGDRKSANKSCMDSGPPESCTTVIALVSFEGDAIKDFGASYGVPMVGVPLVSVDEKTIASDLKTFLNPEFKTSSMLTAGVLSAGEKWWSFSTSDGSYDSTNNCLNGQTSDADKFGSVGLATATDGKRVAGDTASCTETNRLLCICF